MFAKKNLNFDEKMKPNRKKVRLVFDLKNIKDESIAWLHYLDTTVRRR